MTLSSVNAGAAAPTADDAAVAQPPPESLHDDDLDRAMTDLYPTQLPLDPKTVGATLAFGCRCKKSDSGGAAEAGGSTTQHNIVGPRVSTTIGRSSEATGAWMSYPPA